MGAVAFGADPAELTCYHDWVRVMKVLPDGQVVSGGNDGPVYAIAVLPDGRVASGGADRRVLVCDPARGGASAVQLNCSVIALAAPQLPSCGFDLVVVHQGSGFSLWSAAGGTR